MNNFSLTLLGDGQWARWGEECVELHAELNRLYTHSSFDVLNLGVEGTRVGSALNRVCVPFQDGEKVMPSLSSTNPSIAIFESCAFTQFWDGPEGLTEYRDLLRRVHDEIERTTTAKILFVVAAPPPRDRFLEGDPRYIYTSKATRGRFADGVKMFLDEARSIGEDEGWPIADIGAEIEKRVQAGESVRRFFDQNTGDGLSKLGYTCAAKAIVRELDNNRFIEERLAK